MTAHRVLGCLLGLGVALGALLVLGGYGKLPVSDGAWQWLNDANFTSAGILEYQAQEAETAGGAASQAKAVAIYRRLVRRDAANPYRWCDLGEALQTGGEMAQAVEAFDRALILGPSIPPVLVRAGNFYFAKGDAELAAKSYSRVLALTHEYDAIIFLMLRRMGMGAEAVTAKVLPPESQTGANYLDVVKRSGDLEEAAAVWGWLSKHGLVTDPIAAGYVDFLLQKGKGQAAAHAWAVYAGKRRGDFPEQNAVYNSRFVNEPSGSPMDWHIETVEGATSRLVAERTGAQERMLEIGFGGEINIAYHHVWQTLWAAPGMYVVRAQVKSEGLTTNSGVQLHLVDPAGHRMDWYSEPVLGKHDWFWLSGRVTVPNCPSFRLEVVRQLSEKFDSKIAGSIWLKNISVTRVGSAAN